MVKSLYVHGQTLKLSSNEEKESLFLISREHSFQTFVHHFPRGK